MADNECYCNVAYAGTADPNPFCEPSCLIQISLNEWMIQWMNEKLSPIDSWPENGFFVTYTSNGGDKLSQDVRLQDELLTWTIAVANWESAADVQYVQFSFDR